MGNKKLINKILKEIRPDELRINDGGTITINSKGKGKLGLTIEKEDVVCIYSKNDLEKASSLTLLEVTKKFNEIIDRNIKDISNKKGNEIEMKIYSGKIQTLKRLKNDLKTKYG